MKKIIALLLCISAVLMASAGCTKDLTNEDPGAIIPVYLSTEITNFDPAYSNLDKATTKVLGLIYEGLFSADSKGKPVKNRAKSVKVLDRPSDDYYAIEITLKMRTGATARRFRLPITSTHGSASLSPSSAEKPQVCSSQ